MLSLTLSYARKLNFLVNGLGVAAKDNLAYVRSWVNNAYASRGTLVSVVLLSEGFCFSDLHVFFWSGQNKFKIYLF